MTINVTGLPDNASAVPQVRAVAQTIAAPGVSDAAALARQQTVGAVPVPTLVAAYASNIASPPKPVVRNPNGVSSSAYVAQYIAQTPSVTQQDLQLFSILQPPSQPVEEAPVDDFLAQLRIARGDLTEATTTAPGDTPRATPAPAAVATSTANAPAPKTEMATAQNAAAEIASTVAATVAPLIGPRSAPVLAASSLGLPLTAVGGIKKQTTIATSRGTSAYDLAVTRNNARTRNREPIAAVL